MYLNHHTKGFETSSHKGKSVITSSTSKNFESFLDSIETIPFKVGYIPTGYEHRADLISDLFYDTPSYDWLICYFNNVSDPFNQLNVGDRILLPVI